MRFGKSCKVLEIGKCVYQDLKSLGKSGFVILALKIYVLAVNKIK
jgi:hypothetical protein